MQLLKELGCKIPKRGQLFSVIGGLMKMKGLVKKIGPNTEVAHTDMQDENKVQAMKLLEMLIAMSYHSGTLNLPLAILKGFRWTIKFGISEYAPPLMSLSALLLMTQRVSLWNDFCLIDK